jgi:hypothetical protein
MDLQQYKKLLAIDFSILIRPTKSDFDRNWNVYMDFILYYQRNIQNCRAERR